MNLIELRNRIKIGKPFTSQELDKAFFGFFERKYGKTAATQAYDAVLHEEVDAAIKFHILVNPEMAFKVYQMTKESHDRDEFDVAINWQHRPWEPQFTAYGPFAYTGTHKSLAKAFVLADLRALIHKEMKSNESSTDLA